MSSVELTNGQTVDASWDLFDKKNVAFNPLPDGAVIDIKSSDEDIAQWAPSADNPAIGDITTLTDKVGTATLTGTLTLADGKSFSDTITVTVRNSEAGTFAARVGTPREE